MTVDIFIRLKGKTNHGKNRIREHGDVWEVLDLPPGVTSMTPAPTKQCVRSKKTGEWRWLDEKDFEIIPQ